MENPARAWPAWKFGMKRDDLFTTLHDQYNTFLYTLQDPEAFHHDVYEISHDAETAEEFHRMMADRRQMRLRELNESLETLAVEIIANPKLMGTQQWNHALQLFRTKSYDSIVRYFASYLPDDYLDRHDTHSTTIASSSSSSSLSETDTVGTAASCVDHGSCSFKDDDFLPISPFMTCEPDLSEDEDGHGHGVCGALSPPPSEAAHSETSVSSPPSDADSNDFSTNPPSRSMSLCGSESGRLLSDLVRQRYAQPAYDASHYCGCDEALTTTSVRDTVDGSSVVVESHERCFPPCDFGDAFGFDEYEEALSTTQYPDDEAEYIAVGANSHIYDTPHDTLDSDTPTPRPGAPCPHLDYVNIMPKRASLSAKRPASPKSFLDPQTGQSRRAVRRSPEESSSRIHKPVQGLTKKRRTAVRKD
ncbi:hypothetical protein E4U41_006039 [Claviceps citrina]|nr:hypothetical protein E4U41_006039 [Claviceps citrina]